jgi:CBS domain-containing protein
MKVREIMTPDVECIGSRDNLVEAASLMRQLDVGVLPVCDDEEVVGIITDRDIVIRCVAENRDARLCQVRDAMSSGVVCVYDDNSVEDAVRVLEKYQIRRAPVMNRDNNKLVGIISLGDIAVDVGASLSGEALKDISHPAEPVR